MAMGPLAVSDLAGLDVGYRIRKEQKVEERRSVRAASRQDLRDGPPRAEDGRRLLQVRRQPQAPTRPGDRGADPGANEAQHQRRASLRRGDRRALPAPMANEGAKILAEGIALRPQRYRHDLPQRLRLSGLARRPDVVGRQCGRPEEHARTPGGVSRPSRRPALGSRAAPEEAFPGREEILYRLTNPNSRKTQMGDAVIVSTARTPIGKAFRGIFNNTHGAELGAHVVAGRPAREARSGRSRGRHPRLRRSRNGAQGHNIARVAAIRAGLPVTRRRHHHQSLLLVGPAGDRDGRPPASSRRCRRDRSAAASKSSA